MCFTEYDRNPNFIPDDILANVFSCSQSQGNQRSSRMNYVRNGIADSLMRQLKNNNNVTLLFLLCMKKKAHKCY